jgi:hypothetical protein
MPNDIKIGTSIIPPPIPKKPERVPTRVPVKINMISIIFYPIN